MSNIFKNLKKPSFAGINSFLKNTSIVGFNTMLHRLMGYVREIFMIAWMGTSAATDAIVMATRIPGLLRKISTEGVMNDALLPLVTDLEKKNYKTAITNLINKIIVIFVFAFLISFVIQTIFAKEILAIIAPGLLDKPEQLHWFMKYIPFTSVTVTLFFLFGIFSSMLNCKNQFFWPSFAPTVWNIVLIGCFACGYYLDLDWAYVGPMWLSATAIQVLIVFFPYLRLKIPFKITKDKASEGVLKTFFKVFFPIMFSASISQINSAILIAMTSLLPIGNTTVLYRTEKLLQIPISLIIAINITLLPTLTHNKENQQKISKYALTMNAMIFIPVTIAFFYFSHQISSLIFQWGKCTPEDIAKIANLLKTYSFAIPAILLVRTLPVFFFANKEVKIPAIGAFVQTALNVSICVVLMKNYQLMAFAYASIISTWVNVIFLAIMMKKRKYI